MWRGMGCLRKVWLFLEGATAYYSSQHWNQQVCVFDVLEDKIGDSTNVDSADAEADDDDEEVLAERGE